MKLVHVRRVIMSGILVAAAAGTARADSITTTANPTSVMLGGSGFVTLKDTAVLSATNPIGPLTFTLTAPGGSVFDTETVAANGNGTYDTPIGFTLPFNGNVTGTYEWQAQFGSTSSAPEPVIVSAASPNLATTTAGKLTLTDTAVLSGAYFPTGTITFVLIDASSNVADMETVTVSGNGTYITPVGFTLGAGSPKGEYEWDVTYAGDGNNNAVFEAEPFVPGQESTPVPEPLSVVLLGSGIGGLVMRRRIHA